MGKKEGRRLQSQLAIDERTWELEIVGTPRHQRQDPLRHRGGGRGTTTSAIGPLRGTRSRLSFFSNRRYRTSGFRRIVPNRVRLPVAKSQRMEGSGTATRVKEMCVAPPEIGVDPVNCGVLTVN